MSDLRPPKTSDEFAYRAFGFCRQVLSQTKQHILASQSRSAAAQPSASMASSQTLADSSLGDFNCGSSHSSSLHSPDAIDEDDRENPLGFSHIQPALPSSLSALLNDIENAIDVCSIGISLLPPPWTQAARDAHPSNPLAHNNHNHNHNHHSDEGELALPLPHHPSAGALAATQPFPNPSPLTPPHQLHDPPLDPRVLSQLSQLSPLGPVHLPAPGIDQAMLPVAETRLVRKQRKAIAIPFDVLDRIFIHVVGTDATQTLYNCCLVSHGWNAAASPALWRFPEIANESTLSRLLFSSFTNRRQPSLLYAPGSSPASKVYSLTQHIRVLDLSKIELQEPQDSAVLRLLAQSTKNLKCLKLASPTPLQSTTLSYIFDTCSNLESFICRRTVVEFTAPNVDPTSLTSIYDIHPTDEAFFAGLARLKKLDFWGMRTKIDHQKDHAFFRKVGSYIGPNLKQFNLTDVEDGSDEAISGALRNAHSLEKLWLQLNRGLTGEQALPFIAANCPKLQFLSLMGCSKLRDIGVIDMTRLIGHHLQTLWLDSSPITDSSMHAITNQCTALKTLSIAKALIASEDTITQFILIRGKQLKALGLRKVKVVSNATLQEILKHCPQLEELDLRSCELIKREEIEIFVRRIQVGRSRLRSHARLAASSNGVGHHARLPPLVFLDIDTRWPTEFQNEIKRAIPGQKVYLPDHICRRIHNHG
ncbi:uncharacterized protein BJ171DRAFT_203760 [Polychytrium aggregatum]|uniref:uncharacterized protein n=1 Tax=Polychytrium aggregatum TaxID=110093 RepID=UPI0022FF139A|nr:uncharacterized protein BJ171DRAFT_203760 [Polychytrium aggregatum]KAI9199528.1 hypothetical protein BJ171DRAFT_203760 [Polychytrium aggregatum]